MRQQHEIFERTWSGTVSEYPVRSSDVFPERVFGGDAYEDTGSYPATVSERGEAWGDTALA